MKCIPIHTREMKPPQDDLYAVLDHYLPPVKNGDIILITSKVVSIHQGRCFKKDEVDKEELMLSESDAYTYTVSLKKKRLVAIKHYAISLSAGIDPFYEYYITLPHEPNAEAARVAAYIKTKYKLIQLGVIITDSHSMPLRRGVICYAVGFAGISPLLDRGQRNYAKWTSNVVDVLAGYGGLYLGESAQSSQLTPIVIMRGVDMVDFTDTDLSHSFFVDEENDLYSPLLKDFKKKND